jgi:hypothetical protein
MFVKGFVAAAKWLMDHDDGKENRRMNNKQFNYRSKNVVSKNDNKMH